MTNVSPLSGKDAWVKYFQSRGLSQEQAQTAVDTVDLSDGLSQEEATTLGLEAEATIDRYIRQGWAADGEAGVETEEQGVNVVEADELERAYAAISRYADAHNLSYEQAQRIYFQTEISFTRQSLSEVKTQREATRSAWVSEYNAKKTESPDLTFVDWAKERFGITDANDPVLANLEAYIGAHADATPEQLADYLLLNGFAARLAADIQTDPAEGDNPGLGLHQAITGRTAPSDYQVATLEPFYRNTLAEAAPPSTDAPPAETTASAPSTETPVAETPTAPPSETTAQTEAPTERTIYSEQIPSDILAAGETTTAEQLLLVYPLSNDEISAQSREGETALQTLARLYPGVSGWTAVLTETDNSIQGYLPADRNGMQIVTLAYELASLPTESEPIAEETFDESGFRTEIGENGEEIWTFDNSDVSADMPETLAESTVQAEPPVVASTPERIVDVDNGRDIPFSMAAAEPEAPAVPIEPPTVAVNLGRVVDYDNGRDIPFTEIVARQEPSPVVSAPRIEISPEPEIVPGLEIAPQPTVVAEAPAPPSPPPATPRQIAGESLAQLITAGEYNLISITTLLSGQDNFSLKGMLTTANNQLRNLGQGDPLKDQFKAEYIRLLSELSAVLKSPDTADDQAVIDALNGLNNIYYAFDGAEMAAARGDYSRAIAAYEGIENPPAFITARLEALKGLRDTAVAQQTQLADLRLKAGEEYQKLLTYITDNHLTDQDLTGNLAWLEAQVNRLDSMQDPAEIQKFIDSLPGVRTMGEEVVARRETRELAEANADVGTESAPAATRGRLGDIPTNLNDYQLQIRWDGIFRNFRHIAQNLAQQTQQNITIKGYLCFNPATGEIAFSEIESDPYLYGSDGDLLTQSMAGARRDLRFNSMPEFPAGAYDADPSRGEGWYRVQIELYGEKPR